MPSGLTKDQRVDLVRCFHETGSFVNALRKYRREKRLRSGPCSVTVLRGLIKRFKKTGSVQNQKQPGRPSISDIEVAEILQASKEISAENQISISSAREVARRLEKPVSTVRKVMRKTLGLFPYHLHQVHELLPNDFVTRLDFGLKCVAEIEADPDWLSRILWSDEAHVYLHGGVNAR